jgi:hypothetical protein
VPGAGYILPILPFSGYLLPEKWRIEYAAALQEGETMAIVKRPISQEDASLGVTGNCSICDRPSQAYWMAREVKIFEVCQSCAVNKLPLIAGDALANSLPKPDIRAAEAALGSISRAFWRGLALRLLNLNNEHRNDNLEEDSIDGA